MNGVLTEVLPGTTIPNFFLKNNFWVPPCYEMWMLLCEGAKTAGAQSSFLQRQPGACLCTFQGPIFLKGFGEKLLS